MAQAFSKANLYQLPVFYCDIPKKLTIRRSYECRVCSVLKLVEHSLSNYRADPSKKELKNRQLTTFNQLLDSLGQYIDHEGSGHSGHVDFQVSIAYHSALSITCDKQHLEVRTANARR